VRLIDAEFLYGYESSRVICTEKEACRFFLAGSSLPVSASVYIVVIFHGCEFLLLHALPGSPRQSVLNGCMCVFS